MLITLEQLSLIFCRKLRTYMNELQPDLKTKRCVRNKKGQVDVNTSDSIMLMSESSVKVVLIKLGEKNDLDHVVETKCSLCVTFHQI